MENLQLPIVNEIKVTGRAERILIDKAAKLWQRISRWTHAVDVEFEDGKSAQEKLGNIDGITSDINIIGNDNGNKICASVSLVKEVIENLADELKRSFLDGYKKIIGALIAIGVITPEEGDGLSPDDIADLIKNNTGDFKYNNITKGGTLSYVCPKDGYYNIYAGYVAKNNHGHNACGNTVTLEIGSKLYSLYRCYFNSSTMNWVTSGQGTFNDKVYCQKGTVISLSVSQESISASVDVTAEHPLVAVYTVGTLAIT